MTSILTFPQSESNPSGRNAIKNGGTPSSNTPTLSNSSPGPARASGKSASAGPSFTASSPTASGKKKAASTSPSFTESSPVSARGKSWITDVRETTDIRSCHELDLYAAISNLNVYHTLFYLDKPSYVKNVRYAVGYHGNGIAARIGLWSSGRTSLNGGSSQSTFTLVAEDESTGIAVTGTHLAVSSYVNFSVLMPAGWNSLSIDGVYAANKGYGEPYMLCDQSVMQITPPAYMDGLVFAVPVSSGTSLAFPSSTFVIANDGTNNSNIIPWLQYSLVHK